MPTYAIIDGVARKFRKLYSTVNGVNKDCTIRYATVGGVNRIVFQDKILRTTTVACPALEIYVPDNYYYANTQIAYSKKISWVRNRDWGITTTWPFTFYVGEADTTIELYLGQNLNELSILVGSIFIARPWNGYSKDYTISNTNYPSWDGNFCYTCKISTSHCDSSSGNSYLSPSTITASLWSRG